MLEYSADGAKQLENPEEGIHGVLKRGVLEVTLDPLFGSISGIWTFLRKPTSKNLRQGAWIPEGDLEPRAGERPLSPVVNDQL